MVRTAQPRKPPEKPPLRTAEAQRPYRHRNAPASSLNVLERKRFIAKARRKFALVAVRCRALPRQTWNLTKLCDATMNWIFTVSDKHNTAPAFAFTTVTTRLAYRPLPTTPMQVDVPRERAYPNPRLSSPRFRTDRGRQCRSNANWLFWPHTQPVISEDDVLAAASPPYLPRRQQDVIHSLIVFGHQRRRARMYTVLGALSRYDASRHALR